MCPWRTWTHAPWKCSCVAYWRDKAMVKVSVGYHSTLTDIWRDGSTSGLILFTTSLWTFLLEHGRLSNHILAVTQRFLTSVTLHHSGDTVFSLLPGRLHSVYWCRLLLPVAIASCGNHGFQLQWGWWAEVQNSAHGALVAEKREYVSPLWPIDLKESNYIFKRKCLMYMVSLLDFLFKLPFTLFGLESVRNFKRTSF